MALTGALLGARAFQSSLHTRLNSLVFKHHSLLSQVLHLLQLAVPRKRPASAECSARCWHASPPCAVRWMRSATPFHALLWYQIAECTSAYAT
jgi:hypothetical protein